MTDTKLDYTVATDPVQANVGEKAELLIYISNQSDADVHLTSLIINIPLGTDGIALTESLDDQPRNPPLEGFNVRREDGSYLISPADPSSVMARHEVRELLIKDVLINHHSGTAQLTFYELTQDGGQSETATTKRDVIKVVPDLKIGPFTATPKLFHPGEDVVLSWEATEGATITITYPPNNVIKTVKGSSEGLKASGTYAVSNLAETTVFTLEATGGAKTVTKTTVASIDRAAIEKFITKTIDPFFGQEVVFDWVVIADHCVIEHDHKILKSVSGDGGKLSGTLAVTPDKVNSTYTLIATSGTGANMTRAERTFGLDVTKPEVSIDVAHPSFKFNEKPHITWGLKNRWKHSLKAQVVGARTGHVYYRQYLTAGDGHDLTWPTNTVKAYDKFGKAYLDVKLGVGEDLIVTAETAWFKDEDPIKVQKTVKFDGIQALEWDHGSVEEASMGDAIADAYFEQIENVNWPSEAARLRQIAIFASEWGVAVEKMIDPVRWQFFVSIKAENARSIMVRVNTPKKDKDWKKLWSRDDPRATFGDKNWYPVSQDVEGPVSWEGHLYLFAPKSMVKDALDALKFIVGSKEMHVSWHSTGKRIELNLS